MTLRLLIICDTCQAKVEAPIDHTVTWDFDPEWGHRCDACSTFQAELDSDDLLSVPTSPEATVCKRCSAPIFYGRSRRPGGILAFNVEPHHCGYPIESCTATRLGTSTIMGEYVRVGQAQADTTVYRQHRSLRKDLQESSRNQ